MRPFEGGSPVALGALVTLDEAAYFLASHGGGIVLSGGVHLVTPGSPLGRALLGKSVGGEVVVRIGGATHERMVEGIR